ncbi:MAG: SDR family oxidoreductase [Gammaproteobacteria bacterium]|nr:SDR family oxidoreductase [Gammaproteobacteria bacterium]NNC98514.1 SDR family oxidoreductase [Gammaproteobacteria bacterium]NNM13495.1 SDR family oxidoreductase [Gammaproteobacteria bacterium]
MDIKNKVCIVTGGAHGIGRALCRAFVQHGARSIVVADLDLEAAEKLAQEINGLAVRCDVGNEDDIKALVEQTRSAFGQIDIFVSNAGMGISDGPDWTAAGGSNAGWQKCWDVNVMSQVYAARAVIPEMRERGSGYLLNTASAAGLLAQMGDAAYTATKHASVAFAKSLAITHGHDGIGVSVLCPQYVATNMTGYPDDSEQQRGDGVLEAEDVAEICVQAINNEQFMIMPHRVVAKYTQFMNADYQKWITTMQDLRSSILKDKDAIQMQDFMQTTPKGN